MDDNAAATASPPHKRRWRRIAAVLLILCMVPVAIALYALVHLSRMPDPVRPPPDAARPTDTASAEKLPGAEYLDVERIPITLDEVRAAVKPDALKGLSPEERGKTLSKLAERLPTLSDIEMDRLIHDPPFLFDVLLLSSEERYALGKPYMRYRQWRFIRSAYLYSKLPESERQAALDRQLDEFAAENKASQNDFVRRQIEKLLIRLYNSFKQQKEKDDSAVAAAGGAGNAQAAPAPAKQDDFGIYPPDLPDELKALGEQYRKALIARSHERRAAKTAAGGK